MAGQFGLSVRFTLKEGAAEAFDALVAETLAGIRASEPGTLVYVNHLVEGQPDQRIFYELYRDRAAFDEHERQPHTRKFLVGREALVDQVEVDWLTAVDGKGYAEGE
ncbi:antibiotic biosynthesis monooxygenase [Promicromonospora sp. NPDC050262]|uniref:putative quinol monooxygenase n=1 Tax=Promicromonospora sp. NPDC050262 TaxID=3155036 RepID=UPI0033C10B30